MSGPDPWVFTPRFPDIPGAWIRHAALLVVSAPLAGALPYTYIDATPANTTLNGTALVAGSNYVNNGTSGSGTDGKWTYRTDTAFAAYQGGSAFESDNASAAGDAENTAPLITTIALPAIGTYEIVAVFATNSNRDIAARIGADPGPVDLFTASNAYNADQNLAPLQIEFDGSFSNARGSGVGAAYLGQFTATAANQTVRIHVNGLAGTPATEDERTQYEGIGYRLASPKHRDVFLIAGQSNADGRALKSELTGELAGYAGRQSAAGIDYTNTAYGNADKSRYRKWMILEPGYSVPPGFSGALPSTTFGVEIAAAAILKNAYPNPAFIKVTRGGTALGVPGADWYPAPLTSPDAGPLYKALIESTQLALQEITAAGDTYTVHGLFWHQGESDSTRTAQYAGLLTTLIESARRDLAIPNLRFIIGELAETKDQAFRDVQWQVARSMPNAGFLSSRGLVTFEGTHFNTSAMITLGSRLGYALLPDRRMIDFESPSYSTGALDRQDECAAGDGPDSALQVVATTTQGEYNGGQAAGHKGATGVHSFTRRNLLPLASARSIQADFFPGDNGYDGEADADTSLLVAGWGADAGNDGRFDEAETAIGLGLYQDGTFRIQIGGTTHTSDGFHYQIDRWYRLTLDWSEPAASGERTVRLFARDLSTGTDLNGGLPVLSLSVGTADFAANPVTWSGLGCSASRGLVDNIRVIPPGFNAWAGTFYPTMAGGPAGDDDHDGIANAVEFAFGLDPLRSESAMSLPQPDFGPNSATVSFSPLASQPGILHRIEWSRNLSSWNGLNGTRSGNLLEFTLPTTGERAVFIRHRVELTP